MNHKTIDQHPCITYRQDLQQICSPLHLLDISYFSHVKIDKFDNFSAISTHSNFFKAYLQKSYYNHDIHLINKNISDNYFLWDLIKFDGKSKDLYEDFKKHNQGHMFTIMQKEDGGTNCYHFATKLGNKHINDKYLSMLEELKKFIFYYKEKIHSHKALLSSFEIKFKLDKSSDGSFMNNIDSYDTFNKNIKLNTLNLDVGNSYLTFRELDCLVWLAKGKSIDLIAQILSISERTVKAHIRNMKDKLNCNNLFQLGTIYCRLQKDLGSMVFD